MKMESVAKRSDRADDASSGRIRPYSEQLVELSRVFDVAVVVGTLWLLLRATGQAWGDGYTLMASLAGLSFTFVAGSNDLYRSWRSESLWSELWRIAACCLLAAAVTAGGMYLLHPSASLPRPLSIAWLVAAPTALAASRLVVRLALRYGRMQGHNYRRTAVVGSTDLALHISRELEAAPWMGLKYVGCYDDRSPAEDRISPGVTTQLRGNIDELVRAAHDGDVDRVYITLPMRAEIRIKNLIDRLSETPVTVLYVPDFFLFTMLRAQWEPVGSRHAVNVVTTPFLGVSGWAKRAEDLVLSSLILVVIALPMLAIALAIRLSSAGPVLFKQRRYGLNGREFEIWKFRTMTVMEDGSAFRQARPGDTRVTALGRFLRRTSLDELPQFINVLRGDMSIVGPRPHPVALDEEHRRLIPHYFFRHKIRPGITGLAQVSGFRGPTDTLDKMRGRIEHDIRYIDNWSLWLDLRIIVLTILRGFLHPNAH